ncbi:ac145 [Malacosoma neustria nucleopolyhedrovirus]|uniref:ac145 n=1 Tax=Malacosoma neustria nuclear polyhedrosis virus TaxID=38012 RepID=UPI000E35868A|nr:ac145 [Malacosoma neustria nucleopolyhedrovirus]AUF81578.1 ac145 [Malacosoma neustria nucleopolyhedrovirus]
MKTLTSARKTTRTISQLLLIVSMQMLILLILVIVLNKNDKKNIIDCNDKLENDTNDSVCPENYFGNVANPNDCSSFYLCMGGGNKILLQCPENHYFSIETSQCEVTDQVECGNRPTNDIID